MFGHNNNQPADDNASHDPTMMQEPDTVSQNDDQQKSQSDSIFHSAGAKLASFMAPPEPSAPPAKSYQPTEPQDQHSEPTSAPAIAQPPQDSEPKEDNDDYQAVSEPMQPTAHSSAPSYTNVDELLHLKQQALDQLAPLVEHLDQTPEEKFHTTMMMIQANDDQSLLTTAYNAAQQIIDEKTRAQALLDVVNEINYFTQKQ